MNNGAFQDGFAAAVEPHLPQLKRYCARLARSPWDAEDLLQTTLMKAYLHYCRTGAIRGGAALLYRVARNAWIDDYRRRRRMSEELRQAAEARGDLDYVLVISCLESLAERLPSRSAEMWLLSEYFGFTVQELADMMHTSASAVKSQLHRARGRLRSGSRLEPPRAAADGARLERWARAILSGEPDIACS
ncbi:RNA polymerase sigma factor [Paenibacillus sp.]|uniref:RNA polymerase sigma factor n=1 Tax=Paenibacillus sp. TaxID=58172 RepID=UPI002D2A4679|nr:RNA polymerase sigma factor [Paenibacillus sp.]HZG87749.1 RNA polymerase sigma factor [Paenibacillus sp.]